MLAEFQQALADLTASPELCVHVRKDPSLLRLRYNLTERESNRLLGIVRHSGMECACTVYRANRLAPLALNLPRTCRALGADLRSVVSDYWAASTETNVHFYIEAWRFCRFLADEIAKGRIVSPEVDSALVEESALIAQALNESLTEAR
jgi:hypothetical protein